MEEKREKLLLALEKVADMISNKESSSYSEEEKIRVAYALNMCMVSVSQIIDYNDLNILEQEYEGILNNMNLEMMPKDEALLSILKQLLDTITFFRMQEGDKKLFDKEYQQKMKNAIWNAVPNFGLLVAGGNPVTMAVSLASQVGIGYMNYRRTKSENTFNYEKQQWQLQRSAMEQFNGLRRELFDTAWRLADTYNFPDEYRLTERQIKQYDEILMDSDEIRKYERLTTIKDKFVAYPPFWYHYGSTANHIARNEVLPLSDEVREQYKHEAKSYFEMYWKSNQHALLREDQLASACALEYIDLLDAKKDKVQITALLDNAVKFSGNANDILQLCAITYLKLGENDKASDLLRVLVNEDYNIVVNAQILSGIYVHKALKQYDMTARAKYETLATRVNPDYLFRLPEYGENADEKELQNEFGARQEEFLQRKFYAVIQYSLNELGVKLGRLIPSPESNEKYPDSYFSDAAEREKDIQVLFASSYKQKKKEEYLDKLYHAGFVNDYFDVLNDFFDMISEMNCLRDRHQLQKLIQDKIAELALQINTVNKRIEERSISFEDMRQILSFTSTNTFEDFVIEWKNQIDISILGMNDMAQYATADSALRTFCLEHNMPEPDKMLEDGRDTNSDMGIVPTYFSLELLGDNGKKLQEEQNRYKLTEKIIRKYSDDINNISKKSKVYFHESPEFNVYFERNKLKNHKNILQKTIAIYDDKSMHNVDVLFTVDGVVPIIRNRVTDTIPYLCLASEGVRPKTMAVLMGRATVDSKSLLDVKMALQPMIDEICVELAKEA